MSNKTKWNKYIMEFDLYWSTTLGHGGCSGMWWIYLARLHWENWFSLSEQASVTNSFILMGGRTCPLPPLNAGTPLCLNLCRYYVCCYSLCEFICASVLFCLEDGVSLLSPTTSMFYILCAIPFRDEGSKVSHSLYIVNLFFSVLIHICYKKKLL